MEDTERETSMNHSESSLRPREGGCLPEAKVPVLTGPAILQVGVLGTWCLFEVIIEELLCDLYMSTCYAHGCPEEGSHYYSL